MILQTEDYILKNHCCVSIKVVLMVLCFLQSNKTRMSNVGMKINKENKWRHWLISNKLFFSKINTYRRRRDAVSILRTRETSHNQMASYREQFYNSVWLVPLFWSPSKTSCVWHCWRHLIHKYQPRQCVHLGRQSSET